MSRGRIGICLISGASTSILFSANCRDWICSSHAMKAVTARRTSSAITRSKAQPKRRRSRSSEARSADTKGSGNSIYQRATQTLKRMISERERTQRETWGFCFAEERFKYSLLFSKRTEKEYIKETSWRKCIIIQKINYICNFINRNIINCYIYICLITIFVFN